MSLSNTATPKYYGQFRDRVLRGEIPVNREIEMQMNLIDGLIANPDYYYDDKAVEGWIAFCENELTLTDGSDLHLLDSFKLWGEDIWGWYYFVEKKVWRPGVHGTKGRYVKKRVKRRLRNKQFLIVGRGASKSLYGSCHQGYALTVDTSTTYQLTTAPTMKQADEILSPLRTAITRSRGPFFAFLTDGSLQNREDPIGAIEQGAAKIDDWLIIATSSEGTVRNGCGDTIKMELMKILKGEYVNDHVSIWWYKLDDVTEVSDPEMWPKANPNLGVTVSYETYQTEVERAENAPAARNDILAKRFGLPMEGFTYFFTYDETKRHKRKRSYWQMPCAMGADLSQGDDFCAFTFMFPLNNGKFGIKTRSYISDLTYHNLPLAMRIKYDEFLKEDSLVVLDGAVLDLMEVYDDLDKFIEDNQYDVRCFGYDPYNAKEFVNRWELENGPFGIVKVIQGSRTESVPLGELKKLAGERLLLFDESLMEFAMGNCVTVEDTNGNRKLLKMHREQKIDNVSAMMDAFVAYKLNKDAFE